MGINMLDELKEDLVGIDIRFDEPLKRYTYTKVVAIKLAPASAST